jgi:hypothetical protein
VIVAVRVRDPHSNDDLAEERRVRHGHAATREVLANEKCQLVDAGLEAVAREERRIRPAIRRWSQPTQ